MLKRVASLLLCLLFAFSSVLLVACGGDEDDGSKAAVSGGDSAGFLNEAKDWGDQTVTILGYRGEFSYSDCQVDVEEPSDEPVENAFFDRNALIEERYGINIDVVIPEQGSDPITMLRNDMTSGLNEYQAVVNAITYVAPLAQEGLLQDFRTVGNSYLHLDQAWWDQTIVEDTAINDKVFFLAGDALVEDDEATWAIYFNKDIVNTYGLENPYDLVRTGKWNLDKMYEMLQKVELTHGATKSYEPEDADVWGMVVQSYDFYLFMQGCEQAMIDNTGDVPVLRVTEEENVNTFTKIAEFFIFDNKNVGVADYHGRWNEGVYDKEKQIFANGNALFMPGSISYVGLQVMREAEINYGILPMPKRSDIQENYSTGINAYHASVISIPITNVEKLDVTCYALEAMAYWGKELVTPEYYERTLTLKRFKDEDSADMLDLIFRNRTYDLGSVFNFNNGNEYIGTLYFYTNLLGEKSDDIISKYTSQESVFQAGIDQLIAQCY